MSIHRYALVGLFLITWALPATAAETPEQLTTAYFATLQRQDWSAAAKLYAPDELEKLKAMLVAAFSGARDADSAISQFFGDEATLKTLQEMPNDEFFAKFLGSVMEPMAESGQLKFKSVEVLGAVPEGDNVRHVVARVGINAGEAEMVGMEVVTCRKVVGEWKLAMKSEITGLAAQLKKVFGE